MKTDALLESELRRSHSAEPSPAGASVEAIVDLATRSPAMLCAVYIYGQGAAPIVFRAPSLPPDSVLAKQPLDGSYELAAAGYGVAQIHRYAFATESGVAGTVVFGYAAESEPDLALLRRVTDGIATSLEQTLMLRHHAEISYRLQRALLPTTLPSVDGVAFDAAYRPASSESVVGGDWYDAFEIRPGILGISIGDVTGHGLEAAVMMSEIRRAIRMASATAQTPTEVLNFVDAYMVSQNIGMATAIFGFYDTNAATLEYACAGHPHPVLIGKAGRATFLPGGGLLLGIGMEKASPTWTVTLPPQSACYFYTDGLLEYARDVIAGEHALLECIERRKSDDEKPAHALLDDIFASTNNSDDSAVLHVARTAGPSASLTLRYSAVPQSAGLVRDALRHVLRAQHVRDEALFDILTGTGEAIANAIEHSSGEAACFDVRVELRDDTLEITIRSDGHWRSFTPRDERVRGIPIMRAYSSRMNIETVSNATTVGLIFESVR